MSSLFDMPHYAAADHLDEHGYPALAEFFREHAAPVSSAIQETIDIAGKHKRVSNFADKAYVPDTHALAHPYFTFAAVDTGDYKPTEDTYEKEGDREYLVPGKPARTRLPITLGSKGRGYVRGYADRELHQRILHELTGRTDLARELPEVPDTEFSPLKGLGGGLKSKFQSGEHTYQAFMEPLHNGSHSFSFEQLTAEPDQNEHGITGAGNAVHTMTQVAAHFIHGLRKLQPTKVTFTAEEPSRVKLYDKMVAQLPKYAPEYELESSMPQNGGGMRYFVKRKKVELQRGWDGGDLGIEDQEISGPEGWIDEDGNFHQNQPGPYGVRHGDTLTRLGYKNVGEGIRAGLMHLGSADGTQLIGHRSDRQYTFKQLKTLKTLAAKHKLEPAITTTKNGIVTNKVLELSSVDRLWENIHKDPNARLALADHLEENGEPELAKFMRLELKPHTTEFVYRPDSAGIVRGKGNYQGYDIQHPHIYRFMGHDGTHTAFLKTKHMGDKEYLSASGNMSHGDVERLAKELDDGYGKKIELAAEKAPAGGMVSNNQFYEGGKFLPRALKSIREVRNRKLAGKVKLSRQEDLSSLFHNWQLHDRYKYGEGGQPEYPPHKPKNSHNMIAADILQENPDLPSSELHEFLRNAKPGLPRLGEHGITVRTGPHKNREYGPEYRSQRNQESRPYLARRIKSLEDPSIGIHRVYFHHDPKTGTSHIIAAMQTGGNENGEYPTRAYTWHAPATKEQLQALGAKSKRMKLNKLMSPE